MRLYKKYLMEKGMPKGWSKSTINKISKKIGKSPDEKGFFDACVVTMGKHMDDGTAKGLCANMKDTDLGSTYWRNKSHDQATKDVKKKQNVLESRLLTESKTLTLYHGSSVPIKKFDHNFSAQGVFWFSEDKQKIINMESGANSSKYIMTCKVKVTKTAGWKEYEPMGLGQIEELGYDSIKLDDDWIIYDTKNIKVIDVWKKPLMV